MVDHTQDFQPYNLGSYPVLNGNYQGSFPQANPGVFMLKQNQKVHMTHTDNKGYSAPM